MQLIRRMAAALLCFLLLFGSCTVAAAETAGGMVSVSRAAKKPSLKITGPEVVAKGKKITLKASRAVKWKSSNKKVATVNADGVVKGIKAGKVKITAVSKSDPKVRKTWKITVMPKAVKKITITAPTKKLDLEKNTTVRLSASASPAEAAQAFTWTSSDQKVAKVNKNGKVTAVGKGTAEITAAAADGSGKKASVRIKVSKKAPDDKKTVLRIEEGETCVSDSAYEGDQVLREVALPESMKTVGRRAFADSKIRYIYIPAGVQSIAEDAFDGIADLVCLTPAGSYAAGWCAGHGITCCDPAWMTGLEPVKYAAVRNGAEKKVDSGIKPAVSKAGLKWASSDEKIFTVDGEGNISGVYPGHAVLTVSSQDGTVSAKIRVTVRANYRAVLFSESTFDGEEIQRNRGDVRLMTRMLGAVTGPDGGTYKVSSFDDLTASQVYEKIDQLLTSPSRDGDVSLFFFASHGDYRSDTEEHAGRLWCKSRKTWLELPTLAKKLSKIRGKVIVLLESCGPGAALHDFEGGHKPDAVGEAGPDAPDLSREMISAFSSADPGLSVYQPAGSKKKGKNRFKTSKFIVLTAAAYRQVSYMYGGDRQNLFPYWLTRGVGTSGALPADVKYGNKDGKLTVDELYKYVYRNTSYKQTPQVYPKGSDYVLFVRK